ncbi:MAG: alpha-N-arabinofuranosidase [Acidobacteriota bacterium]
MYCRFARHWSLVMFLALLLGVFSSASFSQQGAETNKLIVDADQGQHTINPNIYGHFAEHLGRSIYGGIYVGEDSPIPNTHGIRNDVVEALRNMKIPVLRWPGGCFADEYHWMDGIGPKDQRPSMVNTHWGYVTENNHFGTHEFLELCSMLGCEPYICGNVGSGTVREMQEWVEYITSDAESPMTQLRKKNGRAEPWRLKFWGVGNENWGCGGSMKPDFYADQYLRFATYLRDFGDNRLYKIACGPNTADYNWTETVMAALTGGFRPRVQGLSLHYYTRVRRFGPGMRREEGLSNSATQFGEKEWFRILQGALFMDELVRKHSTIMDKYDPEKRVGLIVDEWGTWYSVEPGTNPRFLYQQNSLRDALVAGLTLNIFNNHSDRVQMGNIAQTVNVLQAVILTDDGKMILTPTYHVFEMFKVHLGATMLPTDLKTSDYKLGDESIPTLNASASKDASGKIHVSLCNTDPNNAATLECEFHGTDVKSVTGRILTASDMTAHNTFDNPKAVEPVSFTGFQINGSSVRATLPAKSVVVLEVE